MKRRIGTLTGGGDTAAINATVKPYKDRPMIWISEEGQWVVPICTGGSDEKE